MASGRATEPHLLFLVLAAAGAGCTRSAGQNGAPPAGDHAPVSVVVTVAAVTEREIERRVPVVGTLDGFETFTLTPKSGGRVKAIHCEVGDRVPPEAVLLEIDPTDYQLEVEQARRSLEEELAKLGVKEPPGETFDIEVLPAVVRARLIKENAVRRYERQKEMLATNATAKEAFEQAETDLKVGEATLAQAVLEARETLAAGRHRQAVLALADERLRDTRVRAPSWPAAPGASVTEFVVARREVSVGEMARPGMAIFELVLDHDLKLRPRVPERFLGEIRVEQAVEVRVEAYPGRVFPGRISRLHPTVDPASRTFEIEVLVPNAERLLKAGGFAKAEILTWRDPRALTIPIEALVTYAGVNKVFAVRDGRAVAVEVSPGVRGRGWLEVTGALEPGTPVVTSGQTRLADGALVEVREPEPRGRQGGETADE